MQTKIPDGGKPLCLLIYADKSRLSSFGTAKAHPVLVRCANLPVEMRNGEGVDGGRLIGWLPIVCDKNRMLLNLFTNLLVGKRGRGREWKKRLRQYEACCMARGIP